MLKPVFLAAGLGAMSFATPAQAQTHQSGHDHNMTQTSAVATEPGQSAFAAIQEIVDILMADPHTDWSKVNIEGLRQHLIDMDNVTLRAEVSRQETAEGLRFDVRSDDPDIAASIERMVVAHADTMSGVGGVDLTTEPLAGGATLMAVGEPEKLEALGFIGLMTLGAHHQEHHLGLARGNMPH